MYIYIYVCVHLVNTGTAGPSRVTLVIQRGLEWQKIEGSEFEPSKRDLLMGQMFHHC